MKVWKSEGVDVILSAADDEQERYSLGVCERRDKVGDEVYTCVSPQWCSIWRTGQWALDGGRTQENNDDKGDEDEPRAGLTYV